MNDCRWCEFDVDLLCRLLVISREVVGEFLVYGLVGVGCCGICGVVICWRYGDCCFEYGGKRIDGFFVLWWWFDMGEGESLVELCFFGCYYFLLDVFCVIF